MHGRSGRFSSTHRARYFYEVEGQSRILGASRMRDGWATAGIMAGGKLRAQVAGAPSAGQSNNAKARVGGTIMAPRIAGGIDEILVKQQTTTNEPAPARVTIGKKGKKAG
ncbi:hypothetical protein DFH09DRAFT_1070221 [Mycena vulgaris]|nr:hypothetical protein DFH09DRAFT_1070221 [Mycena vulgaris]